MNSNNFCFNSLLTFQSCRSLLFTSHYVYLGCLPAKLPPTPNFQDLLGQELAFILSRLTNNSNLFFCKHPHIVFSCSPVLSSMGEIQSTYLTLNIHLTIPVSFISSPRTSSSLVKSHCHVAQNYIHRVEYNVLFALTSKHLIVGKDS